MDIKHAKSGAVSGIIAGVVFGALMGMMGMLPMIAKLVGSSSAGLGFVLHLVFSAIIGFFFALFLGHAAVNKSKGVVLGLVWGLIWWFLGPLIIYAGMAWYGNSAFRQGYANGIA